MKAYSEESFVNLYDFGFQCHFVWGTFPQKHGTSLFLLWWWFATHNELHGWTAKICYIKLINRLDLAPTFDYILWTNRSSDKINLDEHFNIPRNNFFRAVLLKPSSNYKGITEIHRYLRTNLNLLVELDSGACFLFIWECSCRSRSRI